MAKIMLADDADIIKKILKDILIMEGHDIVAEASNGDEVIESYHKFLPDLLILDVTMPVKNGREALQTILNDYPQAKVIMCSAILQDQIIDDFKKIGARGFINKPFNPKTVLEVVNYVLSENTV